MNSHQRTYGTEPLPEMWDSLASALTALAAQPDTLARFVALCLQLSRALMSALFAVSFNDKQLFVSQKRGTETVRHHWVAVLFLSPLKLVLSQ